MKSFDLIASFSEKTSYHMDLFMKELVAHWLALSHEGPDPREVHHRLLTTYAASSKKSKEPVTIHPVFDPKLFAPFSLTPIAMRIAGIVR